MVSETFCFSQLGEGYVYCFCSETKKGYVLLPWYTTATTEEHISKWGSGQEKTPQGKVATDEPHPNL